MDLYEDFQFIDSKIFLYQEECDDDIGFNSNFYPSIPNITLEYSETNIMINALCFNKHKVILPINEFLLKFHPLYKDYLNFLYCNKCILKLLYHEKSMTNFYTYYCEQCDKFLCIHSKNHSHELKIKKAEFYIIKEFLFPICPFCENGQQNVFIDKIDELKLNNKYLKTIIDYFIENKKNLIEIEKDFNNINGKYYINLFPYYEYYMRMNFLECLLCENLLKTYNIMKNKKEMYYQIIKNIENIFHFVRYKFYLGKINGDKYEIESLKNHFKNPNNCFLNGKKQSLNIIESKNEYLGGLILRSNNYNKASLDYITHFFKKIFFFPKIKKFFHLSKNELSIYDFKELKIGKKIFLNNIPINILYIKKNLFIFQYIDKFELYSFHDDGLYVEFKIIITLLIDKKNKIYSKIFTTKDKKFICFIPNLIDFYLFNPLNKNITFIKSINGIYFMKQINENLILFSYKYYFRIYKENGEESEKIDLNGETCLNEEQLCIYKKIYIFIISSNHHNIILINMNNFQIIKKTSFFNRLIKIKEIENENIIDENNKLANLSFGIFLKSNKAQRYENYSTIVIEYNDGIIIYFKYFYFLTNFEKINSSIQEIKINIKFSTIFRKFPLVSGILLIDNKNYLIYQNYDKNEEYGVDIFTLSFD